MPGRVLLATILFLLVAATSAQAADWRPPVDISTPQTSLGCGFFCVHPGAAGIEVAVNSRGDAVATWVTRDAGGSIVQAAFRPAGGGFGAPQTLGPVGSGCFLCQLGATSDAAIDDAGRAVVVWSALVGGNRVVRAATKAPGAGFAPTFDLSDASQSAGTTARLAMSPSGHTIVVWTMTTPNPDVVQFTARVPGGAFSAPTGLSAAVDASFADVAITNTGAATVAWNQSGGIIQARTRTAAGVAFGPTRDLSLAGQSAFAPDVAMDSLGRSTVTWDRPNGSGDTQVQSRALNADGSIAAGIDVMSEPGRDGSGAQVGVDAGGNAVAAWIDCATAGSDCVVVVAGKPLGASFGTPQPVSAPGDQNFVPKVAVDAAGNATVAWSQFGTPPRIQAIRRTAAGVFSGVTTLSSTAGTAFAPTLAVDNQGSVVAGWSFERTSDSRETAQFGVFDAGPPELRSLAFSNGRALQPLRFSVAPFDRFSPVSVAWSFGDGTGGSGPSVTKTYGGPGTFTATVTATDAAGNAASASSAIQVAPPDRDGDGFPQGQDCNDGNAAIRPGALEVPGNDVDENCDGRRPDFPRLAGVTIGFDFAAFRNGTRFTRFQVRRVPRGSTVRTTCKVGKRKCPAKARKAFTKKRARGTVSLKKRYVGVFLPAKAKITVRVTKPRTIGAVKIVTIRRRKAPNITDRCVRPGSSRIRRC